MASLRGLESCQARLECHSEHGLGGQLVQPEVLSPELCDETLPPPGVHQVFVRLYGGCGGECQQPHGLLHHCAVLQVALQAEELLGVLHSRQSLPRLHQLQILLQSDLQQEL